MSEILPFTEEHIGEALALWRAEEHIGLSDADEPAELLDFLLRNPGTSFVAFEDGELVGACLCGHDGRRGYVHHLAVAAGHRRTHIGARLLQACLDSLQQAGIQKCHAFVFSDNPYTELFWTGTGWTRRAELVVFSKDLPRGKC